MSSFRGWSEVLDGYVYVGALARWSAIR